MSQFVSKDQVMNTDINMVQGAKDKLTPFEGHYAFSILPNMAKTSWIIDSGASSHICSNMDMMVSTYRLENPINVHIPDGSCKVATYGGDARVSKDIFLKDVLLVHGFTHNLLSVAQLIQDSNVRFSFLPTHCLIQSQGTDKVLGVEKMMKNLYMLYIGHPSITTLKHMRCITCGLTKEIITKLEQCEVCLKAKQIREPFPILNRRA